MAIVKRNKRKKVGITTRKNLKEAEAKQVAVDHYIKVNNIKSSVYLSELQCHINKTMQRVDLIGVFDDKIVIFEVKTPKDTYKQSQMDSYFRICNALYLVYYEGSSVQKEVSYTSSFGHMVLDENNNIVKYKQHPGGYNEKIYHVDDLLLSMTSIFRNPINEIIVTAFKKWIKIRKRFYPNDIFKTATMDRDDLKQIQYEFTKYCKSFVKRIFTKG